MKLVYGFGINDSDYATQPRIGGRQVKCPAYVAWQSMLMRAYSKKLHAIRPTYIGVMVCEEWKSFMVFREWWLDNHVYGWHLDKDLLGNGKMYSPYHCIYIPSWLNSFTINCAAARGAFPVGVSRHNKGGGFNANCSNPITCLQEHVGAFSTPTDAHKAWMERKLEIANELKIEMDEIDQRLYGGVVRIISNAI